MDKLEYIPGDLAFHYIPKTIIKKYVKVYVCSTNNALSLEDMDGNLYDYIGELYPIPLTPEILEKNGWKLHKHHERNSYDDVSWSSYHKPAETNISLRFYQEEKAFFLFLYAQEISETPIRYIHQLQHLLFGLGINHEMEV